MDETLSTVSLSFRVHFIRIRGPEIDPTVRVLFVETTGAIAIFEGFGCWSQCKLWIGQISQSVIHGKELAAVRKRLEQNRLATIEVRASLDDLGSAGFRRADS
jgi:hypothetical protein